MGKELFEASSAAARIFERVSESTGRDMAKLCFESDEDQLRLTQNTQIALYTCSVAAWAALLERIDARAISFFAGHSVGEYAAVVASGALSVEDGARLVQRRGDLMAASGAVRTGGMAAVIGMSDADLATVCEESSNDTEVVVIANQNSPGQLVISGDLDAVSRASALASERGAKRVLPLNVSGAFHSPLMEESAAALAETFKTVSLQPMRTPVVCNVTAAPNSDSSQWPDLLTRQLKSQVLWQRSVERMVSEGVSLFVECGSGEVLTSLLKRISRDSDGAVVVDGATRDAAAESISSRGVKR